MFSYCESVAGRAQVVDRRTFEGLVTRPVVQQICDQIVQVMNNAQLSDRERQDAVGALKRRLPAFCWHAWFDDGVRKNDRAHASGLVMIDLDHLDEPMRVWTGLVGNRRPTPDPSLLEGSGHNCGSVDGEVATPLQEGGDGGGSAAIYLQGHRLMAAHITPSTKGLRLVFERPEGTLSLEDAQAIIVRDLGLKGVDTCTKDLARLSFCVPKGYWLWVDAGLFEVDSWVPHVAADVEAGAGGWCWCWWPGGWCWCGAGGCWWPGGGRPSRSEQD